MTYPADWFREQSKGRRTNMNLWKLMLGAAIGAALATTSLAAAPPSVLTAARWATLYDLPGPDRDQATGYAVAIIQMEMETGKFCTMHGNDGNGWTAMLRDGVEKNVFHLRTDQPAWQWVQQYLEASYPCGVKP